MSDAARLLDSSADGQNGQQNAVLKVRADHPATARRASVRLASAGGVFHSPLTGCSGMSMALRALRDPGQRYSRVTALTKA